MKQIRLILVVILGVIFSLSANATPLVTEQFQDYATGQLGAVGTGGSGFGNWNSPRTQIVITNGSGSLDGTGLGLVASAGDKVDILSTAANGYDMAGGVPNGCYLYFAQKAPGVPNLNVSNAPFNLYASFLYQFNDSTNFNTNGSSMIAGMYLANGGIQSASGADAYWQLWARTNSAGQIQVGIAKNVFGTVAGVTNWAPNLFVPGQTFFVVTRLQTFGTNGATYSTNDIADLWINPPPSSFGTNEANVPTPSASSPANDGAPPSSSTGPGRFFIVDNGPTANLDELRIGTNSWADVTPPYGQCLPAGFTTNPTNVTQVGGISATFYTKSANSTSPTFQWQISQNGGATWSDIAGAVLNDYTTPNLQYPADNGNEYRAIAYVGCDNTYATSSVATATVTQPAYTPSPSQIMDDTFPIGTFRDVTPVTSTHSVWFTSDTAPSAAADLATDQTGGTGLIATPISGSSSLWLGYYVNETATSKVPIDLAIGTELVATLEFIPNSFNSFTNNGALRFGLFDYADSGTLYTADDPSLTGSGGGGENVRGYMLSLDFGTNFSADLPLSLLVRNSLGDANLMGTTGDYLSMLSGPVGNGPGGPVGSGPWTGSYSNTPAFQPGTTYTLTLTVIRTDTNTCTVAASITGGSLNLSYAVVDTNGFGYHRFDTIAIRPNKLENAADTFTFPLLSVQVANAPAQMSGIGITSVKDVPVNGTNHVTLTWQPAPSGADASLGFTVGYKSSLTNANWTRIRSDILTTNYTDTMATNSSGFYHVTYP